MSSSPLQPAGDADSDPHLDASRPEQRAAAWPLYESVAPAVYGWAAMRIPASLRARIDPEDVLQEVLCRIIASDKSFDPTLGSVRSWVFGFARRVLHEALRRCAREAAVGERLQLTDLDLVPEQATSLTRRVARAEILRAFIARVESLDEEERRLLLLRGLEGLEHVDIARELGITATAVAKRWQRLRDRLGAEFDTLLSA